MDASLATKAFTDLWRGLGGRLDGAWTAGDDSAFGLLTYLPIATVNGVWALGDDEPNGAALAALVGHVHASGVPSCVQARPAAAAAVAEVVADADLRPVPDVPLMVLTSASTLTVPGPTGLTVRRLRDDEAEQHCQVGAAGFEMPVDAFRAAMGALSVLPGLRMYVGTVDEVPVTTALSVPTSGDSVGIFNVATPPAHRGHGYGAAVTAAAIADGVAAGARWSWLQSSPEGVGVYERLGFRTVESWAMWVAG